MAAPGSLVLIAARHAEARKLRVGADTERLKLRWSDIALGMAPVAGLIAALVAFDVTGQWLGLVLAVMVIGVDLSQRRRALILRRSGGPRPYRL
jgi:hypothetical protein